MKYIYLASPYSHPNASVREERYRDACKKTAQYANKGIAVFAPIVHSHPISEYMAPEKCMDFDLWMKMDLPLLKDADELHVLCIDGWRASKGVAREMEFAQSLGLPIKLVYLGIEA
jgi:nucleoside 2-deoxyribosyltransferase